MAITFDQRPTVFGDRIIVTGTFASGDSSIDLSSMMSSVDACIANTSTALAEVTVDPDGVPAGLQPALSVNISGTTVTLAATTNTDDTIASTAPDVGGTFLAIGRRG
jgi:hypothetical protein